MKKAAKGRFFHLNNIFITKSASTKVIGLPVALVTLAENFSKKGILFFFIKLV